MHLLHYFTTKFNISSLNLTGTQICFIQFLVHNKTYYEWFSNILIIKVLAEVHYIKFSFYTIFVDQKQYLFHNDPEVKIVDSDRLFFVM